MVLIGDDVLGVIRRLEKKTPVVLLINFSKEEVVVDVSEWVKEDAALSVYAPSVGSKVKFEVKLDVGACKLPGAASIIFT